MTRLQIIAISKLPHRYICDGTDVVSVGNGWIVACNGRRGLPVISFHDKRRTWKRIRWTPGPLQNYQVKFLAPALVP